MKPSANEFVDCFGSVSVIPSTCWAVEHGVHEVVKRVLSAQILVIVGQRTAWVHIVFIGSLSLRGPLVDQRRLAPHTSTITRLVRVGGKFAVF